MVTRRSVIGSMLRVSAGVALSCGISSHAESESPLVLRRGSSAIVPISPLFTGLGYEMSSVATRGLLSVENGPYVELVKGLGTKGVLRAGGIVANYTRYEPSGNPGTDRQNTVITRESLEQFSAFLSKTGWSAIWSVNFAQGGIAEACEEARAVASALGNRLLAIELGNEVENYQNPFRATPYHYEDFRREYNEWHAALVKAVPELSFAAPDTAANIDWVERMAKDANGKVQLLTTHYYRSGQRQGTAEQLLHADPKLIENLVRLRAASKESGIPWRMCETNSFFGGGRPGVSDTFVGALWTLDFMLLLASYGCSGVNMETGVNQLGFISSYSPIQDDGKNFNRAGVPYYGMLAFAVAREKCSEVSLLDIPASSQNLTAYALGSAGKVHSIVVANRGERDAHICASELGMGHSVSAIRLLAPSAASTSGVTLAGAAVDSNGRWSPGATEHVSGADVRVDAMSAVILRR